MLAADQRRAVRAHWRSGRKPTSRAHSSANPASGSLIRASAPGSSRPGLKMLWCDEVGTVSRRSRWLSGPVARNRPWCQRCRGRLAIGEFRCGGEGIGPNPMPVPAWRRCGQRCARRWHPIRGRYRLDNYHRIVRPPFRRTQRGPAAAANPCRSPGHLR